MYLHSDITINGVHHPKGSYISPWKIYPFFLLHMAAFGGSGFFIAYGDSGAEPLFLFMHGGIAISVYITFYLVIFGREQVKWMFINAGLGLFGIYAEINLLLGIFDRHVQDFPLYIHIIPFLYYVLYTFLLRHLVLDATGSRDDPQRQKRVERYYIVGSMTLYTVLLFF